MDRLLAVAREWWVRFKLNNIVAPEPQASDVFARPAVSKRVIPMVIHKPNGQDVYGWRVFAQNDAAHVEVLWSAWVNVPHTPHGGNWS